MATDDLNAPLGLKRKQAQFRLPPYTAPVAAGLLGVLIVTFAMWALFNNDPLGGEPMATIKIDLMADAGPPPERKPLVAVALSNCSTGLKWRSGKMTRTILPLQYRLYPTNRERKLYWSRPPMA